MESLGSITPTYLPPNSGDRTYILFLKGKAHYGNKVSLTKKLSENPEYRTEAPNIFKNFGTQFGQTKYSRDNQVVAILWDKRVNREIRI